MFETAELGRKLSKRDWEAALPGLRMGLLEAQRKIREAKVPVIVVMSGAEGAGKGETVKRLHEWLDPRGLETNVFGPPTDEEAERPRWWRYWRTLPPRGRIGIFFGSWYTDPIVHRVYRESGKADLEQALDRIAAFERMLVADGTLIVKFWLHLSKRAQRKRLRALEEDPKTRWRVSPLDWKHFARYDRFRRISEQALQRTDSPEAPWVVVEATDDRYRELTVGQTLLDVLRRRLDSRPAVVSATPVSLAPSVPAAAKGPESVLAAVDLSSRLSPSEYDERLDALTAKIGRLSRRAWERKISTVAVFEGWDAGGKGGAIRRITGAMDARLYRVIPIAAPTDEERAQHYLWRFWRHAPRAGQVTISDRSWYGRVLVERVEGFAKEHEWRRAYQEICEFEQHLTSAGNVLAKFWLHISPEEQLRRFEDRAGTDYKKHKITDEDWRNREKWPAYEVAINDMVAHTALAAPWTIVPADDKRFARVCVLETFASALENAL